MVVTFRRSPSHSAPGEMRPLDPPRYASDQTTMKRKHQQLQRTFKTRKLSSDATVRARSGFWLLGRNEAAVRK